MQQDKFKGAGFKYDNIIFEFQPKIKANEAFLHLGNLNNFLQETLQPDKFKGTNLKHGYIFSNMAIFVSNSILEIPNQGTFGQK